MTSTIKDVAKKAGVSISTVSRVINDSKPVSPESRRKVVDAIKKLEYRPNEVARSLVTKKSNLIGVIVDDIGSHYVAQIVRGIEEIGRMYDYDILLSSSYGDPDTEIKFLNLLRTKQAEGIILVSEILNEKLIEKTETMGIEFIYINKYYNLDEEEEKKLNTVRLNHYKAAGELMDHVISKGHKEIMYISHELEDKHNIELEKIKAYKEKMKDLGKSSLVYTVEGREVYQGYNGAAEIARLIKENNITALFCAHDNIAIGINNYFYDNGIKVPEEISMVGYGDVKMASTCRPTLTTIKEPYYDIGAVAVRRILKALAKEEEDEKIVLPMRLMERNSCIELKE